MAAKCSEQSDKKFEKNHFPILVSLQLLPLNLPSISIGPVVKRVNKWNGR